MVGVAEAMQGDTEGCSGERGEARGGRVGRGLRVRERVKKKGVHYGWHSWCATLWYSPLS